MLKDLFFDVEQSEKTFSINHKQRFG